MNNTNLVTVNNSKISVFFKKLKAILSATVEFKS